MLAPEYLEHLPEVVVKLFSDVEDDILRDIARRITKMDSLTDTASYQAWRLEQTRLVRKEIVSRLSGITGKTQAEIRRVMQEAGTETLHYDDMVYRAAGLLPGSINDSPELINLLNAGYEQTLGEFKNLTATTANTVTWQFENACNRAWLQIASGAFDYQTVLRRAVDTLAKEGIKAVVYPSGHSDTLEVAVRRAVLTGVNQTAAKLQIARMDEMGWDLVEVTAHAGARPSHALWQGKIYSRSGKSKQYPPLSVTGYGTGAGLCGWNCRHNFYPYYKGLSIANYSKWELERMNRREFTYNGQKMTRYEATQVQRYLERGIRKWKRVYLAESAAGLDVTGVSVKLAQWRARQKDFLDKTGLLEDNIRHRVSGFGQKQAAQAVAIAQKQHSKWLKSIGVEDTSLKTVAKYYAGKYNNSYEYQLLMGYNRAVKQGDISPLIGFDIYRKISNDIQNEIVGITTANGVQIQGFTMHFIDRIIGQVKDSHAGLRQGVPVKDALNALINPVHISESRKLENGDIRQTFYGEKAVVAISIRDKRLIQTNPI